MSSNIIIFVEIPVVVEFKASLSLKTKRSTELNEKIALLDFDIEVVIEVVEGDHDRTLVDLDLLEELLGDHLKNLSH
jgi:hypothetical protein